MYSYDAFDIFIEEYFVSCTFSIFVYIRTINKKSHPEGWLAKLYYTNLFYTMLCCSRLDIAAQDYTALHWTTLN